ncbi:MAG TPA: citrate lyase holo-[acyl-carrier protein] synthase [Spirochaetia bacterium]|nr:citrate lyase holo-[acyl-carrier protein] synthase [Spirochaetia bacterium]
MHLSYDQMLDAREARYSRQMALIERWRKPLVFLTAVFPGSRKDSTGARHIVELGFEAVNSCFEHHGIGTDSTKITDLPTGLEILFVVNSPALPVKELLLGIEETHPAGRLFDLDVIDVTGRRISREDFGLPPRRCLICEEPAYACIRNRSHSLQSLLDAIGKILDMPTVSAAGHASPLCTTTTEKGGNPTIRVYG